ncbi:MAG: hypothetical protein ACOCT9_01505, partial [archaeon]
MKVKQIFCWLFRFFITIIIITILGTVITNAENGVVQEKDFNGYEWGASFEEVKNSEEGDFFGIEKDGDYKVLVYKGVDFMHLESYALYT